QRAIDLRGIFVSRIERALVEFFLAIGNTKGAVDCAGTEAIEKFARRNELEYVLIGPLTGNLAVAVHDVVGRFGRNIAHATEGVDRTAIAEMAAVTAGRN